MRNLKPQYVAEIHYEVEMNYEEIYYNTSRTWEFPAMNSNLCRFLWGLKIEIWEKIATSILKNKNYVWTKWWN